MNCAGVSFHQWDFTGLLNTTRSILVPHSDGRHEGGSAALLPTYHMAVRSLNLSTYGLAAAVAALALVWVESRFCDVRLGSQLWAATADLERLRLNASRDTVGDANVALQGMEHRPIFEAQTSVPEHSVCSAQAYRRRSAKRSVVGSRSDDDTREH